MNQQDLELVKEKFCSFDDEFDWGFLTSSKADFFKKEFEQEIEKDHPLFQIECEAIAQRYSQDDVLFALENNKWVIVHLTFSKNNLSGWPIFRMFEKCETALDYIVEQYRSEFL